MRSRLATGSLTLTVIAVSTGISTVLPMQTKGGHIAPTQGWPTEAWLVGVGWRHLEGEQCAPLSDSILTMAFMAFLIRLLLRR